MEYPLILNSTNGTTSLFIQSPRVATAYISILGIASVGGTFGNILVFTSMVLVGPTRHKAVHGYVFIGNLAMSDAIVTSIINPFAILGVVRGKSMYHGQEWLCKALGSTCIISCVVSLLTIGCIAFCRYVYICHHNAYSKIFTSRKCLVMCSCTWLLGVLIDLPNHLTWSRHGFDTKTQKCLWDRNHNYHYTVFFVATAMLLPLCLITVFYARIFYSISLAKKHVFQSAHRSLQDTIVKAFQQARMMFTIFVTFSICWLPYMLVLLIDRYDTFSVEVHLTVSLIAHLHASLNFIIYGLCNTRIRQSYKNVFLKIAKKDVTIPRSEVLGDRQLPEGPKVSFAWLHRYKSKSHGTNSVVRGNAAHMSAEYISHENPCIRISEGSNHAEENEHLCRRNSLNHLDVNFGDAGAYSEDRTTSDLSLIKHDEER